MPGGVARAPCTASRLATSRRIARSMPTQARIITTVNGSAAAIAPACSAFSPPAASRAMAIAPTSTDQKIRCHTGDSSSPFDDSMSITSAPESAEVMKNTVTSTVATALVSVASGSASRNRYSATELSADTAATSALSPSNRVMCSALLPYTVSHRQVRPIGTISTPTTNSRMVRPRELRARKVPMNGNTGTAPPQQHADHEFPDGAPARHAGDEHAHERRPRDPPAPVEQRPSADPAGRLVGVQVEGHREHVGHVHPGVLHQRLQQVDGGAGEHHEQ